MLKVFTGALVLVVSATCAAAQKYTFPIDPALGDRYVSDAALTAAIPALRGVPIRLSTCINSMIIPASGTIDFAPTVTGDHAALSNRLLCQIDPPGRLTCETQADDQRAVVFDGSPNEYFVLASHTDRQDALAIFRAFRDATVKFADNARPWIKGMPLREIARVGDVFEVSFNDCGCSNKLTVERREKEVVVTEAHNGICI